MPFLSNYLYFLYFCFMFLFLFSSHFLPISSFKHFMLKVLSCVEFVFSFLLFSRKLLSSNILHIVNEINPWGTFSYKKKEKIGFSLYFLFVFLYSFVILCKLEKKRKEKKKKKNEKLFFSPSYTRRRKLSFSSIIPHIWVNEFFITSYFFLFCFFFCFLFSILIFPVLVI